MTMTNDEAIYRALTDLEILFSDPAHWTKNQLARDSNGEACSSISHRAVCWCLNGGIEKCIWPNGDNTLFKDIKSELTQHIPSLVSSFNDNIHTEHADVMRLIRTAKAGVLRRNGQLAMEINVNVATPSPRQ